MYDDGPGSPNADCRHRGDPGCWGHRHNTLWKFGRDQILMGAGGGRDRRGFQTWATLYESFSPNVTMTFIPSVTGLSHHNGTTRGGTVVRIYGYGFVHVHAVRILGKSVHFSKVNATTLRIRTPRHAAGRGHVVVYGNGGTSHKTGAAEFRYRS
jgi:hypothetical protein